MKSLIYTLFLGLLPLFATCQIGSFEVVNFKEFKSQYLVETDRPVVFNFWATWCKPCVKELPYFTQAAEEHPEWDFVLVSLDFPKQFDSRLKPFLIKNEIEVPVVVLNEANANVYIDPINPEWQGSIPATMIWNGTRLGFLENEFHAYEDLISFITQSINKKQ